MMENVDERRKEATTQVQLPTNIIPVDTTPNLLDQARATIANLKAERELLEKANEEKKALLDREEKLKADILLGGKSLASTPAPAPVDPVDEMAKRYLNAMKGQ